MTGKRGDRAEVTEGTASRGRCAASGLTASLGRLALLVETLPSTQTESTNGRSASDLGPGVGP